MRARLAIATAAAAMLFLAEGWVVGQAGSGFAEDGPGWRDVPKAVRLSFVDGYSQGFRDGQVADKSDWGVRFIRAVGAKQITPQQWKDVQAWKIEPGKSLADKMMWTGWSATNITSGEIEYGMEKFYDNPANQAICWAEAFTLVSHSLAGVTFSEAEMGSVRALAAKNGCD